ncbi:glycosyltransferase family 4 protein [Lactiplantibacillus pentosus]|uniref:glycosyltransferase family 4 protein n=1 Tax=Lactiplantibacillus pentosus TaxID=1589 RepID=UPI0031ED4057
MKISFILPENGNKPIGGFKVVFQYANKLVELGNEVSICFLNNLYPEKTSKTHAVVKRGIKRVLKPNSASRRIDWFDLSSDIQICYNVIFPFELPKADVVVATAVQTVNFVMKLKPEKGKKFYFIQNYETWAYSPEKVNETFALPITKIVIARWLYKIVSKYTKDYVYIVPNFLDPQVFHLTRGIKDRENVVSLLNHKLPEKNTRFGLEVLDDVHEEVPDLKVKLFGVYPKPDRLPDYVTYFEKPSQQLLRDEIYNQSKVYLLPSLLEGWGLTGMEAMTGGAVLVSSDIGGVREYTQNNVDSFLIKPNSKDDFSTRIIDLLQNDQKRTDVAKIGVQHANQFNINASTKMLLDAFKNERINH